MVNPLGEETSMGVVPKMKKFVVVGLFDAGMYDYNTGFVYITIPEAQKFFEMPGRVSGVQVRVDDIYQADTIASAIQASAGYPFYTRNWMEMNKNFFSALLLEKIGMSLILVVIIIVASFNIVGTLTMIVMEKSREIAILKSMGSPAQSIMKIFMFAGLAIGCVGTIIGVDHRLRCGDDHHQDRYHYAAERRVPGKPSAALYFRSRCARHIAHRARDQLSRHALSVMAGGKTGPRGSAEI